MNDEIRFSAKAVDLNLGGLYCTLDKRVELFSKMDVTLNMPVDGTVHDVMLEGIVMRVEEDGKGGFDAALAFTNADPKTERLLARYLLQTMKFDQLPVH